MVVEGDRTMKTRTQKLAGATVRISPKIVTLRTASGFPKIDVVLVRSVCLGLRSHEIGEGCFGAHTEVYGVDVDGRGFSVSPRSKWRRDPRLPMSVRRALGVAETEIGIPISAELRAAGC